MLNLSQIAKTLQRDTRTLKNAIQDINYVRETRSDNGTTMVSGS